MGWLLLLQSLILSSFGVYHFIILQFGPEMLQGWWSGTAYDGNRLINLWSLLQDLTSQALEQRELSILVESFALIMLGLLALLASFGFFTQRKWAWMLAMFVQGTTLGLSVVLYFVKKPSHTYILMLICSFMVIYLQYADIYKSFQKTPIFLEEQDGQG